MQNKGILYNSIGKYLDILTVFVVLHLIYADLVCILYLNIYFIRIMGNTNKKCTISNSKANKSSASLFCIIISYSDHFYIHLALFVVHDFGLVVDENTLQKDVSEKVDELREMLITNVFYLVLKHGFYSVLYFYAY